MRLKVGITFSPSVAPIIRFSFTLRKHLPEELWNVIRMDRYFFIIDLQPPLKCVSISHSDSISLRSTQINSFFFLFFFFISKFYFVRFIWLLSIYFIINRKINMYLLLLLFIGWMISDDALVSCFFFSISIHLFDDSFFFGFLHSVWSFDYGEWNMGQSRNRCDNRVQHKKLA